MRKYAIEVNLTKEEAIFYLEEKIRYPRRIYINEGEREILRGIIRLLKTGRPILITTIEDLKKIDPK